MVKTKKKKVLKKGPIPPQLKKYMMKKKGLVKPQVQQRYPTAVSQLQDMKSIRHFLTRPEQIEIDRLYIGARKAAAIQIIQRRMKDRQRVIARTNPQVIIKKDIMTGRSRIERQAPREAWTQ